MCIRRPWGHGKGDRLTARRAACLSSFLSGFGCLVSLFGLQLSDSLLFVRSKNPDMQSQHGRPVDKAKRSAL
eukprot:53396-Eustigmatos_ZCMA.PRE.1